MDHVTVVTCLSGTVGRPNSLQAHKIWRH